MVTAHKKMCVGVVLVLCVRCHVTHVVDMTLDGCTEHNNTSVSGACVFYILTREVV